MSEEWRAVPGHVGAYEVSSLGRVRSLDRVIRHSPGGGSRRVSGRILRPGISVGRYLSVALGQHRSRHVHSLVAEAFLGPRPTGHQVNHIDNDGLNNRLENLEYVTPAGNRMHALRTGRAGKLRAEEVSEIRRRCEAGESQRAIAQEFHVHQTHVSLISRRRTWTHV